MIIKKIKRMRDYGVFKDFTWPDDLPEFGQYNLIYGWNGTGKTTLSRLFRCIQKQQNPENGKLAIQVGNTDYSEEEIKECMLPVRVFNRDFIAEAVFTTNDEVAPIFVIGEKGVKKQKEVEELHKQLNLEINTQSSARAKQKECEDALDQFCINHAREIKKKLRSSSANQYNNYDKGNFRSRANTLNSEEDCAKYILDDIEREQHLKLHHSKPKERLSEITYEFPEMDALYEDAGKILSRTVVSSSIEALKSDPDLSTWVRDGLTKHKDRDAQHCLFCNNPLPSTRLEELEAHFSQEYEAFLSEIDGRINDLKSHQRTLKELELPNKAELFDDLADDYQEALNVFGQSKTQVQSALGKLEAALDEKKHKLFESLSLLDQIPTYESSVFENLNNIIRKHNDRSEHFSDRVSEAKKALENDTVASVIDEYRRLLNAVKSAQMQASGSETKIRSFKAKIQDLEREIVEHREPAEWLNEDLRKYLGHNEFSLEVKETGYQITRSGEIARGLSEGECTAIALLYFLRS